MSKTSASILSASSASTAPSSPLAAALAAACRPTAPELGPEFCAAPSSGGLHPVSATGHVLQTSHQIAAAKYGESGPLAAEIDLGAVLEVAATLLAPQGLVPGITGAQSTETGSAVTLTAHPCSVPPEAEARAAAIASRRSCRTFQPDTALPVPASQVVTTPTGIAARVRFRRISDPLEDNGHNDNTAESAHPPTISPAALVTACAGQRWVGEASYAALVSVPGPVRHAAAWSLGAAATRIHLDAYVAGLGSCIIGALSADAPLLWQAPESGMHAVVVIGQVQR